MIAIIDGNCVEKGEIAQSVCQCLGIGAAGTSRVRNEDRLRHCSRQDCQRNAARDIEQSTYSNQQSGEEIGNGLRMDSSPHFPLGRRYLRRGSESNSYVTLISRNLFIP